MLILPQFSKSGGLEQFAARQFWLIRVEPYDRIKLVLNGGEFLSYQGGNFNDFIDSKVFTKS